jgi:hypothetical protein
VQATKEVPLVCSRNNFRVSCLVALLPAAAAWGEPHAPAANPQIVLSGFMDLQWEPGADGQERKIHRLGQAEIDVDAEIAPGVGLCLAPSWDPVAEAFGVGTAAVNLRFGAGGVDAVCRERHIEGTGILAGRFDVPFGIDWMLYPSIDRPLISMPLPVAATHGGWNADGVLVYGATGPLNGMLHATSGFDHSRVLDSGGEAIWTSRHAVGGRAGAVPWTGCAAGLSAAGIDALEDGRSQLLVGLDLSLNNGPLGVRGEFLRHRADAEEDLVGEGWYLAAQWNFGPAYGIARWDSWRPQGAARDRRLSLGAGVPVRGAMILRAEYEWWPDAGRDDRLVLQVAAGFGR